MTSDPGVVTTTEPPRPAPSVVLAICAPELIVIFWALTLTEPASPLAPAPANATIPLPPLSVSTPCKLTVTVPAPAPDVAELTCAPLVRVIAPSLLIHTSPANPEPNVLVEISPPLLIE